MKRRKGFTIIESGVVILLIGVITFALFPFVKMVRRAAQEIRCVRNLQKISIALRVYALENEEAFPRDLSFIFTKGYVEHEKVFNCPFSSRKGNAKEPDYIYINKNEFKQSENTPLVYDKKENHPNGRVNILYINGDIVEAARWPSS